jgi:hypothetical protein
MRFRIAIFVSTALIVPVRSESGLRQVTFDVDGSVKAVSLTASTGKNGGSEQDIVEVPYHKELFLKVGSNLYISAQKTRVSRPDPTSPSEKPMVIADGSGTVHVVIKVNGKIVQEATSTAPFGIATASGQLTD